MDSVKVIAPATVANVVCGFDCLGFALSEPFDEIIATRSETPGIRIEHTDDFGISTDPAMNVAGASVLALLDSIGGVEGFDLVIKKNIRPGSGIGSSAASSAGAVAAVNILLGKPFSDTDLVAFAMEGEKLASGSRHADNVAACIFGGFTLVRSVDPLEIVPLDFPDLFASVLHPQIEIRTAEARAILPSDIPLAAAVAHWSNLGSMVAALAKSDIDLIARSMEDKIIEPARKELIPNFDKVRAAALEAGAIGGGISGSGPSLFMLSSSRETALLVAEAMADVYKDPFIATNTYISEIERSGIRTAAI